MPFRWGYADQSVGLMTDSAYFQTALTPNTDTCSWNGTGGQPCLDTSNRSDWNDHFVVVEVDIPDDYTCGTDCWWQIRYVTGGAPTDRSTWSIAVGGRSGPSGRVVGPSWFPVIVRDLNLRHAAELTPGAPRSAGDGRQDPEGLPQTRRETPPAGSTHSKVRADRISPTT